MSNFDYRKYKRFEVIDLKDRCWPSKVIEHSPKWCSVDLRDGNQALIEPMSVSQKKKFFRLLVDIGFTEIEVGFPAASKQDFDFVRFLCEEQQIPDNVTIQVLTQCRPEMIRKTVEAVKGAKRVILHLYNSTSPIQREKVFKTDKTGIINIATIGAEAALKYAELAKGTEWIFQYSPESFSATELDFSVEICNAVSEIWKPSVERPMYVALPSTVEMATPNVYADQIEWFCRNIKNRESIVVSTHTHNDRGCAVAAAELGVMAGAQRVEGTLLGNGERSGNMDIITMAMNLYSQGIDPQLRLNNMDRIVSVVRECTQIDVHPRQPYSGELIYTAFSGSHQDAIAKCLDVYQDKQIWEIPYLPIDPRDIGRSYQNIIRINSQSGKGGIVYVLRNKFGFRPPRWLQIEFSQLVQKKCEDSGLEIQSDEILNLFQKNYLDKVTPLQFIDFRYDIKNKDYFTVTLKIGNSQFDINGERKDIKDVLNDFLDALYSKMGMRFEILEHNSHLLESQPKMVSYTRLKYEGNRYSGVAVHEDIICSSLNAIIVAANQIKTLNFSQEELTLAYC
ncbi:2-isopropylmalate synthase [Nostoc commune]|uniref:2-isopropylmalate synthase n=1 Tax=Nostoc commune TaxID=1178 RepID=UPI0018C5E33E|nr:2-isopropylmalate synthase [Nostoc commune]MBG1262379.1 2-isopropylmalate synthase [Nostoc commune BAE]